MRRIAEVANLFSESGTLTITAFISPFREERGYCSEIIGDDDFIEVFIDADLSVCEDRDPKGLYKKARAGEIPMFTGIDSPYESPLDPDVYVNTGEQSIEECVDSIIHSIDLGNNSFFGKFYHSHIQPHLGIYHLHLEPPIHLL